MFVCCIALINERKGSDYTLLTTMSCPLAGNKQVSKILGVVNQWRFVNLQCACVRRLLYSVCLSVSHSVTQQKSASQRWQPPED